MAQDEVVTAPWLVVIGGSAGSLGVILDHISELKSRLNCAVILVLHRKAGVENFLTDLLVPRTAYKVKEAEDKEPILADNIYIAPADYHLLIEKEHTIALDYSERLHYSRPSIDATFETAAESYSRQVIGILLSGTNDDGVEGLFAIKKAGGIVVAQDPADAAVAYMPAQAIAKVDIDHILHNEQIMPLVNDILSRQ